MNKEEENSKNLKKINGYLTLVVVLVVLAALTGWFWYLKHGLEEGYDLYSLYLDVFPEFFGMLFSLLLIFALLFAMRKSEKIHEYFWSYLDDVTKTKGSTDALRSINESAEKLDKISNRLSLLTTYNVTLNKLKEHSQYWHSWRDELMNENHIYSEVLSNAWTELINAHLDLENEYLKNKKIKNSSESYTILISNISKYLYEEYIEKHPQAKLVRYHVTGMLPEEFFNGPQIEYTALSSTPLIFCHAFENEKYSDSHYNFQKVQMKLPRLEVNRCIVVQKQSPYLENRYNALSQVKDLKSQRNLYIRKNRSPFSLTSILNNPEKLSLGESERLLQHCGQRVIKHYNRKKNRNKDFIKNIIDFDKFQYYSIIDKKYAAGNDNYAPLLDYFSTFFSKSPEDTYYYVAQENMSDSLKQFFRPGFMPEIVLFGLDSNGDGMENKWLLGLQGQYKPFTKEIEIEILKPYEATLCAKAVIEEMFVHKLKDIANV